MWAPRILGGFVILIAALGTFLCLAAIITLSRSQEQVAETLVENVRLLNESLTTTQDGLVVVDETLVTAKTNVSNIEDALEISAETIADLNPALNTVSEFASDELPETLASIQTTITHLAPSIERAENVLYTVSRPVTWVGQAFSFDVKGYDPTIHPQLEIMADSLGDTQTHIIDLDSAITATSTNLSTAQVQVTELAESVNDIQLNIDDARSVVASYQATLSETQNRLNNLENNLPTWVRNAYLVIYALLTWLAFSQIGLWVQGYEVFKRGNNHQYDMPKYDDLDLS